MVDLIGQYQEIKNEVKERFEEILDTAMFINGPAVKQFERNLSQYLSVDHTIACANGTDALQIALMALGLKPGDEVIVPAFTYVATTEVIALLGLTPVMVDVDPKTFNTTADLIKPLITEKTKAIVPVHLFGQCSEMAPIMALAQNHHLYVIEDNAQAIGADYSGGASSQKAGTIGHIGTTSFFPAKNLGCYGDGGAIFTNDDDLNQKIRMVANHGQSKRYHHAVVGVNSRLDSLQAAVLDIKLKYLDDYAKARNIVASKYDDAFENIEELSTPVRSKNSTHVFHQYTLKMTNGRRDEMIQYLNAQDIPCGIYYPIPLYKQGAFEKYVDSSFELPVTEELCKSVFSLPIHTEMTDEIQDYIIHHVKIFCNS